MDKKSKTARLLTQHYGQYPDLQIQDIFKFLFQSAFGCEHMVSSLEGAISYIRKEKESFTVQKGVLTDALDGEYSRVHLAYLDCGLSAETLGKLFFLSAKKEPDGRIGLEEKLEIAKELTEQSVLPFSPREFEAAVNEWRTAGYPPIHHSDIFREKYRPSYRVISNRFVQYLPVFSKVDEALKNGFTKVSLEGMNVGDKADLSELFGQIYADSVTIDI